LLTATPTTTCQRTTVTMCLDQNRHNNERGTLTTMKGSEEKNEWCVKKEKEEEEVIRVSLGI